MGRKKPPPQEIVRGPAVQGRGPQERRETPAAGTGAARTVQPPADPHAERERATSPDHREAPTPDGTRPRRNR